MLLAEEERVMKMMRQTPFLQALEPPRIVPVETNTHATEPNTTEEAPPERIITQDDPSSLQTQVEQPTIDRMPQRSSRTPTRTCIPLVLIDLITIYDDDEGSTTSYIAPVPITYEEAPGEMTTPDLGGPL
jgi:hypothetical protein